MVPTVETSAQKMVGGWGFRWTRVEDGQMNSRRLNGFGAPSTSVWERGESGYWLLSISEALKEGLMAILGRVSQLSEVI